MVQHSELKGQQSMTQREKVWPHRDLPLLRLYSVPEAFKTGRKNKKKEYSVFPIKALIHLSRQYSPSWQSDPFSLPIKQPLESNLDEQLD